jgi:hypothetical protein
MKIGGPKALTDAVKAAGGQVGPRSKWLGAWCLKSGTADWDSFFAGCKADGVTPLVLAWFWGDDISPTAIRDGVMDRYQAVFKTQANLLLILTTVMQKAKTAGVSPIVIVENEFSKNGCEKSVEFAGWYDKCVTAIRANCPTARICFAPGKWGDLAAIAAFYKPQIDKSDMVGTQGLYCIVRSSLSAYLNAASEFKSALDKIRGTSGKPAIIFDLGWSTYGGAFTTTHPFGGGDGKAYETQQATAINNFAAVAPSLNVESVVYRTLGDNPNFDVKNFFGYGERNWGTVRADGTKKPGFAALMALAKPAAPPAPVPVVEMVPRAELDKAIMERDLARARAGEAMETLEAFRKAIAALRETLDAVLAV